MVSSEKFTETEIVNRILGGEKALYEIIVRQFNPYLYKTGRSYGYGHDDTLDLMQETFIDGYRNLGQFEGRSGFKTWIIRIMMNNCYRKKERSGFKNEIAREVSDHSTPMFANPDNDTNRMVQNRELKYIIEDALCKIPPDYRMVFSLREINGLNVSETAGVLNISEANVKVRLNRARTMLRSEIGKTYVAAELFEFNLIYCDRLVEHVMKQIKDL